MYTCGTGIFFSLSLSLWPCLVLAPLTPYPPHTYTHTHTHTPQHQQNLKRYQDGTVVTPDTVDYSSYLKHCIHPDFMRDQLTRSLSRLSLPSLEIFLLHNPEYYLVKNVPEESGAMDTEALTEHRAEMERRLFEAFKALEEEIITNKRITSYGISSNSFSLPPTHPHFLRYDNLLELAQKAAEEVHATHTGTDTGTDTQKETKETKHHFTTMQLPANLVEQEGLTHAVEWAHRHNTHTPTHPLIHTHTHAHTHTQATPSTHSPTNTHPHT